MVRISGDASYGFVLGKHSFTIIFAGFVFAGFTVRICNICFLTRINILDTIGNKNVAAELNSSKIKSSKNIAHCFGLPFTFETFWTKLASYRKSTIGGNKNMDHNDING